MFPETQVGQKGMHLWGGAGSGEDLKASEHGEGRHGGDGGTGDVEEKWRFCIQLS